MSVKERFLRYIQIETTSLPDKSTCPSTPGQMDLANLLASELKEMGAHEVRVSDTGTVYAVIPAKGGLQDRMGLIAHMDTSDAVPGVTRPRCIPDYQGGPVILDEGIVLDDEALLSNLVGQELIVTDGHSVLGADDKAGVAEIMEMASRLLAPDAPDHCRVCVAFTPDEEIGSGVDHFDVNGFGAEYAYTVDGGALGELEYENFNAASCKVCIRGLSFHPGDSKNRMVNACLIAGKFMSLLPEAETPEHTEGYEGFFHLCGIRGDVESTNMEYLIRDHNRERFEARKKRMEQTAEYLNQVYGPGTVTLSIKDSYYNMEEKIRPHMDMIERARKAFEAHQISTVTLPVRGGTDGARLSYEGLPCPNLSTGGYNFHSRKEVITVQALESMTDVLVTLTTLPDMKA